MYEMNINTPLRFEHMTLALDIRNENTGGLLCYLLIQPLLQPQYQTLPPSNT